MRRTRSVISISILAFAMNGCMYQAYSNAIKSLFGSDGIETKERTPAEAPPLRLGIVRHIAGVHDLVGQHVTFESGARVSFRNLIAGFQRTPGVGTMRSLSPRNCREMEGMAGVPLSEDTELKCAVEIIGTGRIDKDKNGISLNLAPLVNGKGLVRWTSYEQTPTTKEPARPVTAGPPVEANTLVDQTAVLAAMRQVKSELRTNFGHATDCLLNPATADWNDISAHYYCLLPYTIRYCYISRLAEKNDAAESFTWCASPGSAEEWKNTRDPMFHAYAPGNRDWHWLLKNQKDVFQYLMFVEPGVRDFNIDTANDVINEFYKGVGTPRLRRASDPWPAWMPEQPSYDLLRARQSRSIANFKGVPPASVLPPAPVFFVDPVSPEEEIVDQKAVSLEPGSYREMRNLEAPTCTLTITKVEKGKRGSDRAYLGGDAAFCILSGMTPPEDLVTYIQCTKGSCRFIGEQKDGELYIRDAVIRGGSVLEIKGFRRTFVWHRTGS